METPMTFEDVTELNLKGEALFQEGQTEEAKDLFLKAVDIHPVDCRTHNNLGVFFWCAGDLENSLAHFTTAYESNPYHRQVVRNLLEVLSQLNQSEEALMIGNTYLSRYPEDDEIARLVPEA